MIIGLNITKEDIPNVLVIMASYNGEQWISSQLDSLISQNAINCTIWITDDNSNDLTQSIIQNYSKQYAKIKFWTNENKSNSACANFFRAIENISFFGFNFVSLADQDDVWNEDKLSSAIKMLKETGADAYSSNITAFWNDGKTKLIDKAQTQRQFDYIFESAGPGCTFVLTQKLALHLQLFLIENQLACKNVALHDWFIYAFARKNGYKWVVDKRPHMQYRQHEKNVMGANAGLKAKLTRWRKLRAGWHSTQAILLAEIIGYSDSWVIKRLKRNNLIDKIVLIVNVSKFRRKYIDRLALAISFLVGIKK